MIPPFAQTEGPLQEGENSVTRILISPVHIALKKKEEYLSFMHCKVLFHYRSSNMKTTSLEFRDLLNGLSVQTLDNSPHCT